MATTAQPMISTVAIPRTDERRTFSPALLVLLIVLAVMTVAVVASQVRTASSGTAPSTQVPEVADPWAAYRPGGSVYQQQVPAAAADPWAAMRPGGSVYQQQVPAAAAVHMGLTAPAWQEFRAGERAGGSVYEQQVPAAARQQHMGLTVAAWQEFRAGERDA